MLLVIKLE